MNLTKKDWFQDWIPKDFGDIFDKHNLETFKKNIIPSVNVTETPEMYVITVCAAGLNKEDLKVKVTDGVLELSYKHEEKKEDKAENYLSKEFVYRSFDRKTALPKDVDQDKITANFENGIFKIVLPRDKEKLPQSKEIEIS